MRAVVYSAVLAVVVAACVPMKETYLEPNGEGQILDAACNGSHDRLRTKLPHGVYRDLKVVRTIEGNLDLLVSYYVPSDASIRLVSGLATIADPASNSRLQISPSTIRQQCGTGPEDYGCEHVVAPTTTMDGATIKDGSLGGLGKADRGLFYEVTFPFASSALVVSPPTVEINGAEIQGLDVEFHEGKRTVWAGLCQ